MKMSKAVYNAIFNVLVAVIMSAIMSFILTIVNVGMVDGFLAIWLSSLLVASMVAIPVTFITIPLVGKLLSFMQKENKVNKVLYIKANVKPAGGSRSFNVSDEFIEAYKKKNPQDEIITLDLYQEDIDFLSSADVQAVFGPKTEGSKSHRVLKYAYQFLEADKYIISAPFWNLGFPAILKAYLDYICITGITFQYTENGPVGLCKGKKAVHVVSRGGHYLEGPATGFEMGDRYLKVLFGFLGIEDFSTIAIEGVDVMGADVDGIVGKAVAEAREVAAKF